MASFELNSPERSGLVHLRDYHTFGRREDTVDTVIDHSYASKLHAIIEWNEPNWFIKDVSKNGIKLNNKIIPSQTQVRLNIGDTVDFAGTGSHSITITNVDAPKSLLVDSQQPNNIIELTESLLLPNEDNAELALHFCPDREQWFSESLHDGEERGPYEHGTELEFNKTKWQILLVSDDDATKVFSPDQTDLSDITFRFDLSQDEECTELTLIYNGREIELGERSHHYLLVHLLRYRIQSQSEIGWLDNKLIMKELGVEESHLNIQIFRARKQVSAALKDVTGNSRLIERRRGALRAGISKFEIYKEGVREI